MPSLESRKTISGHDSFSHCQATPAHEKLGRVSGLCGMFWEMLGVSSVSSLPMSFPWVSDKSHTEAFFGGGVVVAVGRAAFLSLKPMHLFVSKEGVFQHLGERKQQADTMQEKPDRCVAAKGQGPQGHGTFSLVGISGSWCNPTSQGVLGMETLSGHVDKEAFLVFRFPFCTPVPPSIKWGG